MMKNEFKLPSGKELVVLEMLVSKREMYGLEMVKASSKLRRGTIYVLLNRMEEKGYIKSHAVKEDGASGMPKRLYRVMGLGQRAYLAWQSAQDSFFGQLAGARSQ